MKNKFLNGWWIGVNISSIVTEVSGTNDFFKQKLLKQKQTKTQNIIFYAPKTFFYAPKIFSLSLYSQLFFFCHSIFFVFVFFFVFFTLKNPHLNLILMIFTLVFANNANKLLMFLFTFSSIIDFLILLFNFWSHLILLQNLRYL